MYHQRAHRNDASLWNCAVGGRYGGRKVMNRFVIQHAGPVSSGQDTEWAVLFGRIIEMNTQCQNPGERNSRRMCVEDVFLQ
jgi:hypothetical protein